MKKTIGILTIFIGSTLLFSGKAFAYTENGTDPISDNTQNIKQSDTGSIDVEGWIGTFDPTKPIDPETPTPEDTSTDWIDVSMPTKVLFGSLKSDNGAVYSPKYTITNNSVKGVKVSAANLVEKSGHIQSGLELNLNKDDELISLIKPNGDLLSTTEFIGDLNAKSSLNFDLTGTFTNNYPSVSDGPLTTSYILNMNFSTIK